MTVQNRYLNTIFIAEAPIRIATNKPNIEQVAIVLDGSKKSERILSHALSFAREQCAELVVVHTYKSEQDHAELYIKSVKNKMLAQYNNVTAFLYNGTSASSALQSIIDNQKQTCVMVMNEKRNWLQHMVQGDIFAEFSIRESVLV